MRNLVISLIGLLTLLAVAMLVDLWRAQTAVPGVSTTRVALNGLESLEMSLTLSPGPYFVSELITADVSLANYSRTTFELDSNPCDGALGMLLTSAGPPDYVLPTMRIFKCPPPLTVAVNPGQTLTVRHFVPLTTGGAVTLTGTLTFVRTASVQGGGHIIETAPDPFNGRRPSTIVAVDGQVPPEQPLSLEKVAGRVIVHEPPSVPDQTVYQIFVVCGAGSTQSGFVDWRPVQNAEIPLLDCPASDAEWTVSVSAPGYAIVSARYR